MKVILALDPHGCFGLVSCQAMEKHSGFHTMFDELTVHMVLYLRAILLGMLGSFTGPCFIFRQLFSSVFGSR